MPISHLREQQRRAVFSDRQPDEATRAKQDRIRAGAFALAPRVTAQTAAASAPAEPPAGELELMDNWKLVCGAISGPHSQGLSFTNLMCCTRGRRVRKCFR